MCAIGTILGESFMGALESHGPTHRREIACNPTPSRLSLDGGVRTRHRGLRSSRRSAGTSQAPHRRSGRRNRRASFPEDGRMPMACSIPPKPVKEPAGELLHLLKLVGGLKKKNA